MRARRGGWATVVLAVTGGVAALGPVLLATAQPAWAFVAPVKIIDRADGPAEDFDFNPRTTQINVGDGVSWTNTTQKKHTVTSDPGNDPFDSDEIGVDGNYTRRFKQAGTYTYRCKIHPKMTGVIEVRDPSTSTTTATAPAPTTTAPAPTTTTAPPTTTTTAPPSTTTTAAPRPPAAPLPVPASAAAPPPTLATSSTTTVPTTTSTTAAPTTTVTSAPPPAGDQGAPPGTAAPSTTGKPGTGDEIPTAAGLSRDTDDNLDVGTVALVALLVAVGVFGAWTLIRVRPGRV